MRQTLVVVVAAAAVLSVRPAAARWDGDLSVLGAESVAPGASMVIGRAGWPDLSVEYVKGVTPWFDAGLRAGFLYGVENRTDFAMQTGAELAVPLRFSLARTGRWLVLFHVDPGVRTYGYDQRWWGMQAPFGVVFELPGSAPLKAGLGVDLALTVMMRGAYSPQVFVGPLAGPWLEFRLGPRAAVGIDTRFGVVADSYAAYKDRAAGHDSAFGYRAQAVFGMKL